MSKEDLKKTLKPLIKQCIREVVFEEGFLSGLISEVIKGTNSPPLLSEQRTPARTPARTRPPTRPPARATRRKPDTDHAKKVMKSAFGGEFYEQIFEGVAPITSAGKPGASQNPQSPLSGVDPNDKGVDIDKIFGPLRGNWKHLI
jgi:hypothetical protein